MEITVNHYLILSALLFTIGVVGVLLRRNAIIIFMSIELMLNAVNLTLVTFSRHMDQVRGESMVFFVMAVAAAEAAIGLAILVVIYRNKKSIDVDELNTLRW